MGRAKNKNIEYKGFLEQIKALDCFSVDNIKKSYQFFKENDSVDVEKIPVEVLNIAKIIISMFHQFTQDKISSNILTIINFVLQSIISEQLPENEEESESSNDSDNKSIDNSDKSASAPPKVVEPKKKSDEKKELYNKNKNEKTLNIINNFLKQLADNNIRIRGQEVKPISLSDNENSGVAEIEIAGVKVFDGKKPITYKPFLENISENKFVDSGNNVNIKNLELFNSDLFLGFTTFLNNTTMFDNKGRNRLEFSNEIPFQTLEYWTNFHSYAIEAMSSIAITSFRYDSSVKLDTSYKGSIYTPEVENMYSSLGVLTDKTEVIYNRLEDDPNYRDILKEMPSYKPGNKYSERTRKVIDLEISCKTIEIKTERTTIKTKEGEIKNIYAHNQHSIAPSNSKYTYNAMAEIVLLVINSATPMNRLRKMLKNDKHHFSINGIWSIIEYVANRFLPIYLTLGKELNNCSHLMCDDTFTDVLELTKIAKNRKCKPSKEKLVNSSDTTINSDENKQEKINTRRINKFILSSLFKDSHPWKRDKEKLKTSTKVSMVTGRKIQNDSSSKIVFFKTHQGTAGDLLNSIINLRDKDVKFIYQDGIQELTNLLKDTDSNKYERNKEVSRKEINNILNDIVKKNTIDINSYNLKESFAKNITVTSDLSSDNIPCNTILNKYNITYKQAGCMAHALRHIRDYVDFEGFVYDFEKKDGETKLPIGMNVVYGIKSIYNIEHYMKKNKIDSMMLRKYIREFLGTPIWNKILKDAKEIVDKFPHFDIRKGAQYIYKHAKELSEYLRDPNIPIDNNYVERNLRIFKLYRNCRFFSKTQYGQSCIDICLTILRTAITSRIPPKDYIMWVLKSNPLNISSQPENYTPYAYYLKTKVKKSNT